VAELDFDGAALGRLVAMIASAEISRRAAKTVLERMDAGGGDPAAIVEELGLAVVADESELEPIVAEVLAAWPDKVAEYREGNRNLLGLFMGQVMKATGGSADPGLTRALLQKSLDG